jgi:hypothetical protein
MPGSRRGTGSSSVGLLKTATTVPSDPDRTADSSMFSSLSQ